MRAPESGADQCVRGFPSSSQRNAAAPALSDTLISIIRSVGAQG